jgi:hypothetical protein
MPSGVAVAEGAAAALVEVLAELVEVGAVVAWGLGAAEGASRVAPPSA